MNKEREEINEKTFDMLDNKNIKEEIEELEEDNIEVEIETRFNLLWTCPNCHEENVEYDISPEETVLCECEECSKKYEYYYNPY